MANQLEENESQEQKDPKERTIMILAAALALVAVCMCGFLALSSGISFFGRGEDDTPTPALPIIVTATLAPTPTPAPTPEPGQPPQAVIYAPNQVTVGVEFEADGSYSTPADQISGYQWDFGDGVVRQGAKVKHAYSQAGNYVVALTVTDRNGLSNTARTQIQALAATATPQPQPPNAVIQAPAQARVGEPVVFNGNGSTGVNPIVSYSWDFGDRTQGSGMTVEHVYSKSGVYQVTLTVTDNTGLTSTAKSQINIADAPSVPPDASIQGPANATAGQDVTFSAEASQPGSSPIASYAWDFGNGDKQQGQRLSTATTRYSAPGKYSVSVVVTDQNGQSDSAVQSIQIDASLESTLWTLTQTLAATTITAEFERGTISGNGGCNDYTGGYTLTGSTGTSGAIAISDITMSQKACPGDVMSQETRYLNALQSASSYMIVGDTLTLSFAGGTLVYTIAPAQ
ncbi:MAG: PKD domain-containing protein [Caldilineales bacterium]|nr:PKD domain-containing protein [Caldilineales bacterium]